MKAVRNAMIKAEVYVLEEEEIIGFIGLRQNYVEGIFVDARRQSQGAGKKLL